MDRGPEDLGGGLVLEEPWIRFLIAALLMLSLGTGLTLLSMRASPRELHNQGDAVLRPGEEIVLDPPEEADLLAVEEAYLLLSSNTTAFLNVSSSNSHEVVEVGPSGGARVELGPELPILVVRLLNATGPQAGISYDYVVRGRSYELAWVSLPGAILATAGVGLLFIAIVEKMFLGEGDLGRETFK